MGSTILLLVTYAKAYVFKGKPQLLSAFNDNLTNWFQYADHVPDGKTVAFRENKSDPNSNFIFNVELDYRLRSTSNRLNDVYSPALVISGKGSSLVIIPNTTAIPPCQHQRRPWRRHLPQLVLYLA